MAYERQLLAQIERLGEVATVYRREQTSTDRFNNTEWGFDSDPDSDGNDETALCFRTYDNRNTEVQGNSGDRNRDAPLFIFPADDFPGGDVRLGYPERDGGETIYELQAPTRYQTHVEIFGEVVTN